MQIEVYDITTSDQVDLPINVIDNDSFNALLDDTTTSFEFNGVTYTISRDTNYLRFHADSYVNSLDEIMAMFDSIGLNSEVSSAGNFNDGDDYPNTGLYDYRAEDSSSSYPAIQFTKTENTQHPGNYSYNVTLVDSGQHSLSLDYHYDQYNGPSFGYGKVTGFKMSNLMFYGVLTISGYTGLTPYTEIEFHRATGIASTNYVEADLAPGDEKFKPVTLPNKGNRGGGTKNGKKPAYQSSVLEQPGAPDEDAASIIGSGYINLYTVDKANLANLGACLFSTTFLTFFQGLFLDPLASLISLNVFPCSPITSGSEAIKIYKYSCTSASLGANAFGGKLSKQYKTISFGSIAIGEMFQSYLDYIGTSFSLYLPFIGEVDIPVAEVMGGKISLEYTIDFCTGTCVANVLCEKGMKIEGISVDKQYSQHSYQGNCACQIPLSSVSYGSVVGSLINAVSTGLSTGAIGAGVSLMKDGLSGGFAPTIQTKGSITANGGFCSVLYPYVTVVRPITAEPDNFQTVMGYPSYMDATLASCKGLCICDNIDLHGVTGATDNEINRIKQMCREGVYV